MTTAHTDWINKKVALLFNYAADNRPLDEENLEWLVNKVEAIMDNVEKQASNIADVDDDRTILLQTLEAIDRAYRGSK